MAKKINSDLINEWADAAHAIAKEKGFWNPLSNNSSNKAQMLLLVISELTEALENERKQRPLRADLTYFESEIDFYKNEPEEMRMKMFCTKFITCIKDSTEDEIADTLIRIFDFMKGFSHEILIEFTPLSDWMEETNGKENSLSEQLYITAAQVALYPLHPQKWYSVKDLTILQESALNKAIRDLLFICEVRGIDIEKHIKYKSLFNQHREFMNGKRF